ncbi:MAG: DUF2267 domain-containing protein [Armatimonadetes bacterium]|nr:DUF2267 domain-containing protein [Armatimonadota bacterium]
MQYDEFLKQVRLRGGLHNNDEARSAIRAVFETLKRRIVHDTGDNIKAQLPHDIQPLWESGFIEHISVKAGGTERMDLTAFLGRVADRLETNDFARVEIITRAVFTTLRQAITPGAQESVERELPEDLRGFWLACQPPEMPQEAHAPRQHTQKEEESYLHAEVHPPSEERLEVIPPPGLHKPEEGPGSTTHYRLDPQLEQEIKELLDKSDEVEADKIDIFVQAGNVTLRGTVKTDDQRQTAGHIAAKALGVGDILNELSVEEK